MVPQLTAVFAILGIKVGFYQFIHGMRRVVFLYLITGCFDWLFRSSGLRGHSMENCIFSVPATLGTNSANLEERTVRSVWLEQDLRLAHKDTCLRALTSASSEPSNSLRLMKCSQRRNDVKSYHWAPKCKHRGFSAHNDFKGGTSLCNGVPEDDNHDPVKAVETKQHELIKSLMNLGSTLDNLLKEMGKSG